ncbi:MAG: hypothetical protein ACKOXO_10930 [Cyanobium sp.]
MVSMLLNARTFGVATEPSFDAAYLLTLWTLVIALHQQGQQQHQPAAKQQLLHQLQGQSAVALGDRRQQDQRLPSRSSSRVRAGTWLAILARVVDGVRSIG